MDDQGRFVARILDTGLRGLAAGAVARQREALAEQGSELPPGAFEELTADTEARLVHLGEALACGRPALFVEHVQWSRSNLAARGLGEERLALDLACLRRELEERLPEAGRDLALEAIDAAGRAFDRPPRVVPSLLEEDRPHTQLVRRVLLALLEARHADALDLLLGAAAGGVPLAEIESEIVAPVQWEMGRMWQRGEVDVHEEHLGTGILEEALVLLRARMSPREPNGRSVLVSSAPGNLHVLGARLVADHFEMDGWSTLRLGQDLPAEDIVQATFSFPVDLVALSVTLASQVRASAAVVELLRASRGAEAPRILVGGPPFQQVDDLWRAVGADGWAPDPAGAVRVGRELVGV